MSLAEDLLNSLPEDQATAYSLDPATEPHIIINADKTVAVPEELKRILVQYDHNVETVTFDCPRYWDGHDLSQMGLRIMFQRSDGHREPHPVENLRIDPDNDEMIHFDWTISENTTLTSGNVKITVCAKLTNAEGVSEREWHTIPNQDLFVNEGMECSGEEIVERNPDVIEYILAELDELKSAGGNGFNPDSGENTDYELPVGGDELGGVKNGGNVIINEDGTMTAPESEVTEEQVAAAVSEWLEANPDATTTVQDGAITAAKLADDAVTAEKTAFLLPVGKLVESECIIPGGAKYAGYADSANSLHHDKYIERPANSTSSIFACKVKAGVTYTLVPYLENAGGEQAKFCTAYALKDVSDEVKAAWARNSELLGKMSYTDAVPLSGAYVISYNERQTKIRFVPTTDGYIVGQWHTSVGMLVYEGASPSAAYEEMIDAPDGSYTMQNYPFYAWTERTAFLMKSMNRVEPDGDTARLLRRGEYYQNLILSNMRMTCIGDSITFGASVGVGDRYHDFLEAKLGIDIGDVGVNGATVTTGYGMAVGDSTGADGFIAKYLKSTTPSLLQSIDAYGQRIYSIALGTNDWIYNAPLGTYETAADYDSTATYTVGKYCTYNGDQYICTKAVETAMEFDVAYWSRTFFGCYKKLIARIRELRPAAPIILITPWQQFYNGIHWNEANEAGYSIRDYGLAIHEIAMMTRNCWVLDMLNNAYITEQSNSENGVYVDGVHIGRKAHILVAHELEKILMQVIMMNGCDYVPIPGTTDSFTGQK